MEIGTIKNIKITITKIREKIGNIDVNSGIYDINGNKIIDLH